jgi:dTDP-4-dehydrorhamnose reductase
MRILLFGRNGQVGWELQRALQPLGTVTALSHREADFDDPASLRACFSSPFDVVVNAAAYTAVDQAEKEEASAMRVNAEAVGVIAEQARRCNALLIHYSTDYVFDGSAATPYAESDPTNPLSAYGRSKLAGEANIAAVGGAWLTMRTSWVFGRRGKNFVKTMLRLAGERDTLRVVDDQVGAPTSAPLIADVTAHVIRGAAEEIRDTRFASAVLHLTAGGSTSWHGFATRAIERAARAGMFGERRIDVQPITTDAFPLPGRRPMNSRLDTERLRTRYGIALPDWTIGADACVDELTAR